MYQQNVRRSRIYVYRLRPKGMGVGDAVLGLESTLAAATALRRVQWIER